MVQIAQEFLLPAVFAADVQKYFERVKHGVEVGRCAGGQVMAQNFDDFGIFGTVFYQRKNELEEVKAFQVFFVKLDVCGDSVAFGGLEFFLQVIDAGGGTVVFKQAVQLFFQFADIRFGGGLFKGYGGRGCFFPPFRADVKKQQDGYG